MLLICNKFLLFFFIIFGIENKSVKSEQEDIFTAISDMELMVSTESSIIKYFHNYLNDAESKISRLKKILSNYRTEYNVLSQTLNQTNEMMKSVALYKVLSKFNKNFYQLEDIIEYNPEKDLKDNVKIYRDSLIFPTKDDLNGAISGLVRLQDVYDLTIDKFFNILDFGANAERSKLDFTDFYLIGLHLYNGQQYAISEQWIKKALDNYNETMFDNYTVDDKLYGNLTKHHLLEMLSFINYKLADYNMAIHYAEEYLKIKPNDADHIQKNIEEYKMEKERFEFTKRQEFFMEVYGRYKQGCRNELKRKIKFTSQLQCWYLSETSFFLQYAPVKIEEINFSPEMFLFHDVIYDSEIKKIQNLSKGKLTRARVFDIANNSEYKSEIRTNKLVWLKSEMDPVIKTIRQRIGDITGLSMKTAEDLQIANYGIGGHYEPHLDYYYDQYGNSVENMKSGNRIATLVFYLSDVKAGGATVFPLLNITIFPQKGSALFWYNLFSNGGGDVRTFHAACPVLEGDKWILNEWMHEREQEFNRPCTLKRDDI